MFNIELIWINESETKKYGSFKFNSSEQLNEFLFSNGIENFDSEDSDTIDNYLNLKLFDKLFVAINPSLLEYDITRLIWDFKRQITQIKYDSSSYSYIHSCW